MNASFEAVDAYLAERLLGRDPVLDEVLAANHAAGLPAIDVSATQGRLLQLLAEMIGARRILEVGTLGGYSSILLARALPADGQVITIEVDPKHAEVARANLARAGVADRVEVKVGRAIDVLPTLAGPFDLAFIDADKSSNPDYLAWALRLARVGSVIVVDNVVREGRVLDANGDEAIQGTRRVMDMVAAEPRVRATAIQTVGTKGWDGLLILRVIA